MLFTNHVSFSFIWAVMTPRGRGGDGTVLPHRGTRGQTPGTRTTPSAFLLLLVRSSLPCLTGSDASTWRIAYVILGVIVMSVRRVFDLRAECGAFDPGVSIPIFRGLVTAKHLHPVANVRVRRRMSRHSSTTTWGSGWSMFMN